jgi:hypothetical protein
VSAILLADASAFLHAGDRFRPGGEQFSLAGLAAVASVGITVVLACWLCSRWLAVRQRRISNHPRRLFAELCRAHRLTRAQQRVLERVARRHHLPHPARVFRDPRLFAREGHDRFSERKRRELEALEQILFAED